MHSATLRRLRPIVRSEAVPCGPGTRRRAFATTVCLRLSFVEPHIIPDEPASTVYTRDAIHPAKLCSFPFVQSQDVGLADAFRPLRRTSY